MNPGLVDRVADAVRNYVDAFTQAIERDPGRAALIDCWLWPLFILWLLRQFYEVLT